MNCEATARLMDLQHTYLCRVQRPDVLRCSTACVRYSAVGSGRGRAQEAGHTYYYLVA